MQRYNTHISLVARRCFATIVSIFIIITSTAAHAIHDDISNGEWGRPTLIGAGTVTGFYLISRADDSSTIFGGLYSLGSLYTFREWANADSDIVGLILPFSLLTLAMVNFAVFHDEQTFHRDEVFLYNIAAVGALTAYFMWDHAMAHGGFANRKSKNWDIAPLITNNEYGVLTTIFY